jgi:hypothetical protein
MSKYANLTTCDNSDDDDDDIDPDNNTTTSSKPKTTKSVSNTTQLNKIFLADLTATAKRIAFDKGVNNYASVFNTNMLKEIVSKLPRNKEELTKITHFTENLYQKYSGEEFLPILQNYAKRYDDLNAAEIKRKQEQYQKEQEALKLKNSNNNFKTSASFKNSKTYDLLDESTSQSIDYDPSSFKNTSENSYGKKRTTSHSNFSKSKKPRTGSDSPNTSKSAYFKKKNYKAKFKKFAYKNKKA